MNWKNSLLVLLLALFVSVLLANSEDRAREEPISDDDPVANAARERPRVSGRVAWSNWRAGGEDGFPVSTPENKEELFPEQTPPSREKLEEDLAGMDVAFGKRKVRGESGDGR